MGWARPACGDGATQILRDDGGSYQLPLHFLDHLVKELSGSPSVARAALSCAPSATSEPVGVRAFTRAHRSGLEAVRVDRDVPIVIATILRTRGVSGVQTHVAQFAQYMSERGVHHEVVTAFSAAGPGRLAAFGVRRIVEPLHGGAAVAWYSWSHRAVLERVLRARLSALGPTVVYCQCPIAAQAALRARRGPEQRVVLAVHFLVSQADEWVTKRKIVSDGAVFRTIREGERSVADAVDGIVFVSEAARATFWLGETKRVPSVTIPNFVRVPDAVPSCPRQADLVSVGSLESHKNHRFLLEVLAAAAAVGRRYTLHIMGDGPERAALRRQARRLGLGEQVQLRGLVPNAGSRLGRYGAYAHASTREALPLVVIEAMAAGLPVLAAPVGGIPQLFDDGVQGLYWPLAAPRRAAEALVALLSDERRRSEMGAAARRRVQERFDSAVVAPALHAFLVAMAARSA